MQQPAFPSELAPYPTLAISGKAIFFALAALRSVPHRKRHLRQAGSQFHGLATPFCEISGLAYTIAAKWWWKKLLKWVELVYMRNHLLGKLLKITSHR
jgi:hypothetical protein